MTFGEIEFLDEPEPARVPAFGAPAAASIAPPSSPLLVAAVVGWLGAAALAVWAPFRMFYAITISSDGSQTLRQSLDGWGRIAAHTSGGSTDTSQIVAHAARYGVALCVCAGLAVAGLVALLLAARTGPAWVGRTSPLHRIAAGLGIAVPCLLAGLIAAVALTAQAQAESLRAGVPQNISVDFQLGGFFWLSLVALGCAVLGSAGCLLWYLTAGRHRPEASAASDG